jgi:hypothetical protein
MNIDYVAYIGIDWADRKHDIALYDCATASWEESVISTRPQDILDWVNQLRQRYGSGQIAVGLEQKRGPLLYALCQYDNLVLVPINPRTVANYRKAFQPSRAKSDPVDARILVELMRKHEDKLEIWVAGCPNHRVIAFSDRYKWYSFRNLSQLAIFHIDDAISNIENAIIMGN